MTIVSSMYFPLAHQLWASCDLPNVHKGRYCTIKCIKFEVNRDGLKILHSTLKFCGKENRNTMIAWRSKVAKAIAFFKVHGTTNFVNNLKTVT